MMFTECPHGDDPAICPPCQGPTILGDGAAEVFTARARLEGWCPECRQEIEVGDLIAKVGDRPWAHEECT